MTPLLQKKYINLPWSHAKATGIDFRLHYSLFLPFAENYLRIEITSFH